MTRTLRRLALAAAVPVALLAAGCGTPQAGAAAVVGDRRISIDEVQDAYRDITILVGQDLQATQADMLTFLIIEPYLTRAAAEAGQGVSEDDARRVFEEVKDRLPDPPVRGLASPSDGGLQVARAVAARERIQTSLQPQQAQQVFQSVVEAIRGDEVEVNPRFGGTFDYTQLVIAPTPDDWIRQTAPPAGEGLPGQGGDPNQDPNQAPPQDPNQVPQDPNQVPQDPNQQGQGDPGQGDPGQAPPPEGTPAP